MNSETRTKVLVFLLRLAGVATLLAFGAIFLPTSWMRATHEWLGLGAFPEAAVTQYLTRSIAALYAMHGGLLLTVSFHVERCRPVIAYLGWANICFGALMVGVDLKAGLPLYWTLAEGPPVAAMGAALLWFNRPGADPA